MVLSGGTPTLTLNLLGTPEVLLNEEPLALGTAKAQALLTYLVTTKQPQSRSVLVNLLWGEMAEPKARRNLTATLTSLRKPLAPFLEIEPDRVGFNRGASYSLDVEQFRALLTQGRSSQDMGMVREAIAYYRGDFLDGLVVKDGFAFEEWVYTVREQLREQHLQALQLLVDDAVTHSDYASGLDYAHQLLTLDPWREVAHRQLMLLHARNDRRDAALAQYETCRKVLAEELGVDPSPETMALHQRLLTAEVTLAHNLPPAPNGFIGRETELQQITDHLADPSCRLLTVVGPGGAGKTRLALEAGRRFIEQGSSDADEGTALTQIGSGRFADGVYFVSLIEVVDSADAPGGQSPAAINAIVTAVADAIGFAIAGSTLPQEQLLSYLSSRAMLLIGDNFEELLHGENSSRILTYLSTLLAKAPKVKLLITSRIRLKLQEEWVLTIDGLPYPAESPLPTINVNGDNGLQRRPEPWSDYAAVHLFVQRAAQMQLGIAFSEQEMNQIAHISWLLEGLPLGLELAATWVTDLSCREIAAEIEAGMDILSADLHNLPTRHRSLRAVFGYSWRVLTEQEQTILCKLAIFRGGFTRDAAKEVADASLPMLVRLAEQTLIRRTGEQVTARRYDIHALIRQFILEKTDTLSQERLGHTYSAYFAGFAANCYSRYLAGEYLTVMPLMAAESDNFRAAWVWLVQQILAKPQTDETEIDGFLEQMVRFVAPLAWFYHRRTRYLEGIDLLEAADSELASLMAAEKDSTALHLHVEILRARLQIHLAMLKYYCGEFIQTQQLVESALPIIQRAGLVGEEAFALYELSKCTRRRGDYAQTKALAERSKELASMVDDQLGQAKALTAVAVTAADEGDYALAEDAGKKVVAFYRQLNDTTNLAMTQSNLGNTYIRQKKFAEAKPLLEEAYAIGEAEGNLFSLVMTGTNLASAFLGLDDPLEAERHNQAALSRAREIGNQRWTAANLNALSKLHAAKGDWRTAERFARESLRITTKISSNVDMLGDLSRLGHALAYQGKVDEALRILLFVQQHPATTHVDKAQNQALFAELLAELPATLRKELEAWCGECSLDELLEYCANTTA